MPPRSNLARFRLWLSGRNQPLEPELALDMIVMLGVSVECRCCGVRVEVAADHPHRFHLCPRCEANVIDVNTTPGESHAAEM